MPPAVAVWSPNHWTTGEFPHITFFFNALLKFDLLLFYSEDLCVY